MANFSFEFVNGGSQFESGYDALREAVNAGHLNTGDRGSITVALFDIHDTSHFRDAAPLRENISSDTLRVIAQALVDEALSGRWKTPHRFKEQLFARNPNLMSQLKRYGIEIK